MWAGRRLRKGLWQGPQARRQATLDDEASHMYHSLIQCFLTSIPAWEGKWPNFLYLIFLNTFTYLLIFGCAGSSLPHGLSSSMESGGSSIAACRLLSAAASLAAGHRLGQAGFTVTAPGL